MAAEGTGDPSPRPRCPREQSSLRSDGRGFGIRGQRDADPSPHFSLTSLATPRFSLLLSAKERLQLPVFRHEALEPDQPASLSARRRDRTRRMRRRSCRCRRGPSAWRRVPAGCAWFPSHAPCGVSASPACSPPVVRARRVPTTSRADKVHGRDTHPPPPPGHTAPSQAVLAAARPPGTVDGHQSLQCGEAPGGGPEVLPGLPPRSLLCWGPFDVEPGAPVSSSGGRRGQARRPGSVTADVLVTPARRRGSEQVPTL